MFNTYNPQSKNFFFLCMYTSKLLIPCCIVLAVFFFASCHKHTKGVESPTLIVHSPIPDSIYNASDSLLIAWSASDDVDLHEAIVELSDEGGNIVFADYPYVHGKQTFSYNKKIKIAVVAKQSFGIRIRVEDHDGGSAEVLSVFFME